MTPPATCNRLARYCFSQPGHRTFARYEHDPVLLHERLGLIGSHHARVHAARVLSSEVLVEEPGDLRECLLDRKSTRLNSSHTVISYAVFCLKKKIIKKQE